MGTYCAVDGTGHADLLAEVVAVHQGGLRLAPLGPVDRVALGARVSVRNQGPPCPDLDLADRRAINALGQPIDGGPPIAPRDPAEPAVRHSPLDRTTPRQQVETGVRAIDALLPLGQGQKIGLFAPSGAGKSTLLEQLCRNARCDRLIMCQVGERGREVERAWRVLGARAADEKFTLVAATADDSASLRVRALDLALALAEHARARGEHVLLMVDSITRVAMALRELGIAAGEPPAARGYTANVFSHMPRQVERCGALRQGGAITAVFSVLSETEEVDDPIVEMMKAILDGHIVLSRSLAERRHFPAIDIARSVSRLADDLAQDQQKLHAARVHRLHATFEDARAMIESGIYASGSNPAIDDAVAARPLIDAFLCQGRDEASALADTLQRLATVGGAGAR